MNEEMEESKKKNGMQCERKMNGNKGGEEGKG